MEFAFGFLAGSVFWFWGLILLELIILMVCIEHDSPLMSIFSLAILLVVANVVFDVNLLGMLFSSVWSVLIGIVGYGAVGLVHLRVRWKYIVLADWEREFKAAASDREKEELKQRFPRLIRYKGRAFMWFFYWPVCVLHWLGYDALKRLWNRMYGAIRDLLLSDSQAVYNRNIGDDKKVD